MNWARGLTLLLVVGALSLVWDTTRDGRMGAFIPASPPADKAVRQIAFRSTTRRCCTSDVQAAGWNGSELRLDMRAGEAPSPVPADSIVLRLRNQQPRKWQAIPWSEAAFWTREVRQSIFVADPPRHALLEIDTGEKFPETNLLLGTDAGRIIGMAPPDEAEGDQVFWFTTQKPDGTFALKRYEKQLEEVAPGDKKRRLTGVAVSSEGDRVYAAGEGDGDLVWLVYEKETDPEKCGNKPWHDPWILARFQVPTPLKGRFRGLVLVNHIIIGSAPGGLYFVAEDGEVRGQMKTDEEISYLFPGFESQEPQLFAVAGRSVWTIPTNSLPQGTKIAGNNFRCPGQTRG